MMQPRTLAMIAALLVPCSSLCAETAPPKQRPFVKKWTSDDLSFDEGTLQTRSLDRGRKVFHEAGCIKCHRMAGKGEKYGPDLTDVTKRFRGQKLLQQILKPSSEIHKEFETFMFVLEEGRVVSGLVIDMRGKEIHVLPDPLKPQEMEIVDKSNIDEWRKTDVSTMPEGLLDTFDRDEILDLLAFLQSGENIESQK